MSKAGDMAEAYLNKLPDGERWYEHRKSICAGCPLNSKNGAELSALQKVTALVAKDGVCSVCGCPTERKTSVKHLECPDTPPKWTAVEAGGEDKALKDFSVSVEDPSLKVEAGKLNFVVSGGICKSEIYMVAFTIKTKLNVEVISTSSSCGCTKPLTTKTKDGEYLVTASVTKDKPSNYTTTVNVTFTRKNMKGKGALVTVPVLIKFKKTV